VTFGVEVVVAGGLGDLMASMLGDYTVERCPTTTRLLVDEDTLPGVLARLEEADADVLSIAAVPTPDG
jgi:hypothetical protein